MIPEAVQQFLNAHPDAGRALAMAGVLALAMLSFFIARKILVRGLTRLAERSRFTWDDLIFSPVFLRRLSYLAPIIVLYTSAAVFGPAGDAVKRLCMAGGALFLILAAGVALSALNDIYAAADITRGRSIKGYIQIFKIILYIAGAIVVVSTLLGRSPMVLLSGFGALTAVFMLIFRDTILSFVASIQIHNSDMVRVGDWIEVPALHADGDVVDLALHTVTVQNWDKTLTYIPTHKLLDTTFKNWRGMQLSGGRRIKRALLLDMESVRFVDQELLQRFEKIALIRDYVTCRETEIADDNRARGVDESMPVNGRRMTNLGTFRAYVVAYLKASGRVHPDMTFLVRQLAPTPQGLPLEIYVFANDTVWAHYEAIQADLFDHLIAALPVFGLKVFQNPRGDFSGLVPAPGPPEA